MFSQSTGSLIMTVCGTALVALGLVFKFILKDNTKYRLCAFGGYLAMVSGIMGSGYLCNLSFSGLVSFLIVIGTGFIVMSVVFVVQERGD